MGGPVTADGRLTTEVLAHPAVAASAPAGPAGLILCAAAGFFTMTVFLAGRDRPGLPAHYASTERLRGDLDDLPDR